jgi:hypothetical protein
MNKYILSIGLVLSLVSCQSAKVEPKVITYEKLYTYKGCTYYRFNTSKKAYSNCGTWKLVEEK